MIPTTKFLGNVARALRATLPLTFGSRCLVARPLGLGRVVLDGERRRKANEKRLGVPIPRFCIISVTWRCNLDCAGCYAKNYPRNPDLPLETIARVIGEANKLGSFFFVIVGGEPLLRPGLIEMLGTFQDALFFLFTNGTLLTKRHARKIKAARSILPIVSVEGDKRLTDLRRGGGVGAKAAAAMDTLRRERVPFGFAGMLTRRNLHCLTSRAWFDDVWKAGARFGFLLDYIPIPPDVRQDMVLTDEDRDFKTRELDKRFYEARPMVLNFPAYEYTTGECLAAGRGMMHINADGNVEPCPFCHYAADNIEDKSLPEILGSRFFTELRAKFCGLPNPSGDCLLFSHIDEVRKIAERTGAFNTEQA